jgi:hypothetical protein
MAKERGMKRFEVLFFALGICALLCVSFTSCFTLTGGLLSTGQGATEHEATEQGPPRYKWITGQFTNERNDDTGIYFTKFTGSCEGTYSNTWDRNSQTTIEGVRFSHEEGLYFETSNSVSFFDETVKVIILHPDGTEYQFAGHYANKGNYGRIIIQYTEELSDSLLGENIVIRFNTKIYHCQFNFPSQFNVAYDELKQKFIL